MVDIITSKNKEPNNAMRILYLLWMFPLLQFIKIVGVYGSILNYLAWLFLNTPFSEKYIAGLGLAYYLVFFELPLLFRSEPVALRRVTASKPRPKKKDTKERGREFVEYTRGKTKVRSR